MREQFLAATARYEDYRDKLKAYLEANWDTVDPELQRLIIDNIETTTDMFHVSACIAESICCDI